jgi:tRNA threonylcarbamoyladenosine modification (KEOPS) complex Cgi121 subunit
METLLFASAQHQINKAIKKIGINTHSQDVVVTIVANKIAQLNKILSLISKIIGKEPDETVLEISNQKQKKIHSVFEISKKEIEAVMKKDNIKNATRDIILEKMALLSTKS